MAAAQHGVYCNAASNLIFTLTRISGVLPAKKGTNHACRNHQLPPVLEALQCKLERALSARRPRIGRYRHHPIGHSADRVGKRQPLNSREIPMKAPAVCGRFHFGSLLRCPLDPIADAFRRRPGERRILDLDAQIRGAGIKDEETNTLPPTHDNRKYVP